MISESNSSFSEEIQELNTKTIGRDIYHFKTIDSTNFFAKKLVNQGVKEGAVVVSDVQLSGRGRKDRTWSSPEGGLWFSILLYPNIPPQSGMLITMASSIAVAQGIKEITGLNPEIKWPNDLLVNGKKVCGILTELDAKKDTINYSVVGIGLNVSNPLEEELQDAATTLKQELSDQVSKMDLLKSILENFDENYNKLISGDYNFIKDSWLLHSNIIGKTIQVQDDDTVTIGKVTDIDDNGYLILDTENGTARIVSGDVKYL
jgi:BirA family biotin operon repressor/biotin-[acetyl-CoA-carboxylase] ligase